MDLALERLAAGGGGEQGAAQGQQGQGQQAQGQQGQQVETVLGIFDLRGFTSANADWGFVRFLVDIFFLYYPKASCGWHGIGCGCRVERLACCAWKRLAGWLAGWLAGCRTPRAARQCCPTAD